MAHGRILATGLLLGALVAAPVTVAAQGTDFTTVTSEDGLVTINIPDGVAPAGVSVGVVLRSAADAPPEIDPAAARPFYEITPVDVVFSDQVEVRRRIVLADVGIDPVESGLPLAVTAIRDGDGNWSWLESQTLRYEYGGSVLELDAGTRSGGQLFPAVSASLTLAPGEGMTGTVGEVFRLEAVLGVPPGSASMSSVFGASTNEPGILVEKEQSDFDFLGRQANSHEYRCLAPGTSQFFAAYTVEEIADVHPVTTAVGLDGTVLFVSVHGEVTCEG